MGLPPVVRSKVPPRASYSDYREELRWDFWFSCAYCTLSEAEAAAIGFQIDHFEPQDPQNDSYENLMWSCQRCNRHKSNIWPPPQVLQKGYRYIRPDSDYPDDHLRLDGLDLRWMTLPGEFTVRTLRLNRKQLKDLREIRRRLYKSKLAVAHGLQVLTRFNADKLKREGRHKFREALLSAKVQATLLDEAEQRMALVRSINRSAQIDPEPTDKKEAVERREYLKSIGAIVCAPRAGQEGTPALSGRAADTD